MVSVDTDGLWEQVRNRCQWKRARNSAASVLERGEKQIVTFHPWLSYSSLLIPVANTHMFVWIQNTGPVPGFWFPPPS